MTDICWAVAIFFLNGDFSQSYQRKLELRMPAKIKVCEEIVDRAETIGVDPTLAVAVAYEESRLRFVKSKKGAQGPMGVLPKYHCPVEGYCDLVTAGIEALGKNLYDYKGNVCKALAVYNRGLRGRCSKGRSEYYYAKRVMKLQRRIKKEITSTP
jgi:soluble lytic murein transglycosylase-like protein